MKKKFNLSKETVELIREYIFSDNPLDKAVLSFLIDILINNAETDTVATLYVMLKDRYE